MKNWIKMKNIVKLVIIAIAKLHIETLHTPFVFYDKKNKNKSYSAS